MGNDCLEILMAMFSLLTLMFHFLLSLYHCLPTTSQSRSLDYLISKGPIYLFIYLFTVYVTTLQEAQNIEC
jgi:hypothetical protein